MTFASRIVCPSAVVASQPSFFSNVRRINNGDPRPETGHANEVRNLKGQQVRDCTYVADRDEAGVMNLLVKNCQHMNDGLPRG